LSASASRRKSSTSSDVAAGIVFQNSVLLAWRTALGNIMLQAEARKLNMPALMASPIQRARRYEGFPRSGS
jgi:ABC-type nitrate/sulfonate/bicarbonate transport system ATPase subunit